MQTLWTTTLTPHDQKVARCLAEQIVSHYEKLKKHGYQKYDTRDSREREKAIRQNLCGIYSEMAVRTYLSAIVINFRANIDAQVLSFDASHLTAPDFLIEWPRASGKWRELEVKSN